MRRGLGILGHQVRSITTTTTPTGKISTSKQRLTKKIVRGLKHHDIIFENNHVIAINKRPGLLSQPDSTGKPDAASVLKKYIKETANKKGEVYLGALHRLDRPASGAMIFARTSKAAGRLSQFFRENKIEKEYIAVVSGQLTGHGMIPGGKTSYTSYWAKRPGNKAVRSDLGKDRRDQLDTDLHWAAISPTVSMEGEKPEINTFVAVKIKGGRKHQIRRQLAGLGHPIIGDQLYGSKRHIPRLPGDDINHIYLHASRLKFPNPILLPETASKMEKRRYRSTFVIKAEVPRVWRKALKELYIPELEPNQTYYEYALENSDDGPQINTKDLVEALKE